MKLKTRSSRFVTLTVALVASILHAQTPAPQTPALAKGTGVVMGRVVDAATGQPIAEAIVTLEPDPKEQAQAMAAVRQMQASGSMDFSSMLGQMPRQNRTLTDNDGVFVVRDVRKGTLNFHADARGYLSGNADKPVELAEGGRALDVKIALNRGAVVSGTVVDDRGEPAVGATVYVYGGAATGSTLRTQQATGKTDDRGTYRISQLAPGDYIVGVPQMEITTPLSQMEGLLQMASSFGADMRSFGDSFASAGSATSPNGLRLGDLMLTSLSGLTLPPAKDGRLSVYESVYFPGVPQLSQATLFHLRAGEEHPGVDLQLHLVPASSISGLVSGAVGPLANAPIRLEPSGADASVLAGFDSQVASTTAKRDGTFVMLGVPDGEYTLIVEVSPPPDLPEEFKSNPIFQAVLGMSATSKVPLYGRMTVAVHGSDVRDLSVVAGEGATLSGRLHFEGQATPTSQAIQQTRIELAAANDILSARGAIGRQPKVNADGTFKTGSYPPGRYSVTVMPGDLVWTPKSVLVDGHDLLREAIELSGTELSNVLVTLTDKPAELRGTVRSESAALPDHVTVVMVPQDYRSWIANGMPRALVSTVSVPKDGTYRLQRLPSGDFLVAALVVNGELPIRDTAFLEAVARAATHVTIAEGDRKTQDLRLLDIKR